MSLVLPKAVLSGLKLVFVVGLDCSDNKLVSDDLVLPDSPSPSRLQSVVDLLHRSKTERGPHLQAMFARCSTNRSQGTAIRLDLHLQALFFEDN